MCPVCFTGADTVTRETLNAGIGVLLGVTMVILALFARFFLKLARRSRAAAHLVDLDQGRPSAYAEATADKEGRPLLETETIGTPARGTQAGRDRPSLGAEASAKAAGRPDDRRVA